MDVTRIMVEAAGETLPVIQPGRRKKPKESHVYGGDGTPIASADTKTLASSVHLWRNRLQWCKCLQMFARENLLKEM